ncbi:type II secretion system protein, partial [bacterium]|nr:type II secretion system protein [bacterium]
MPASESASLGRRLPGTPCQNAAITAPGVPWSPYSAVTLVELLVVSAVIGVLASLRLPSLGAAQGRAR